MSDAGEGMGKAISNLNAALTIFNRAKPVISSIPSNYGENFNHKYNDVTKLKDSANNENKSIYFEKEIPFDQLPKLDCQNLVKLETPSEGIDAKIALEDKLRHIVPP